MNLELPFAEVPPADLEASLAAVDRELDALFLEEIAVQLIRLDAERTFAPPPDAASA